MATRPTGGSVGGGTFLTAEELEQRRLGGAGTVQVPAPGDVSLLGGGSIGRVGGGSISGVAPPPATPGDPVVEMIGSVQSGLVTPRPTGGSPGSGGGGAMGSVQAGARPRGGDPLGGDGTQAPAAAPQRNLLYPDIPGGAALAPRSPTGRRGPIRPPAPVRVASLLGF